MECAQSVAAAITPELTAEALGDVVKDVQNKSTLSVSDRAAIATYAICMNVASYADIPAALERFGSVVHSVGLARAREA